MTHRRALTQVTGESVGHRLRRRAAQADWREVIPATLWLILWLAAHLLYGAWLDRQPVAAWPP
jgi:hypothetical protein